MSLHQFLPPGLVDILPQNDLGLLCLVATAALAPLPFFYTYFRLRPDRIKVSRQNVLVIGASSGIGRAIAIQYARRGDRVCITGRRQVELDGVKEECLAAIPRLAENRGKVEGDIIAIQSDFTKPEDMVAVREHLDQSAFSLSLAISES
jgi:NADPH:quinone reductase-like Zn-dependent oxidoreductase